MIWDRPLSSISTSSWIRWSCLQGCHSSVRVWGPQMIGLSRVCPQAAVSKQCLPTTASLPTGSCTVNGLCKGILGWCFKRENLFLSQIFMRSVWSLWHNWKVSVVKGWGPYAVLGLTSCLGAKGHSWAFPSSTWSYLTLQGLACPFPLYPLSCWCLFPFPVPRLSFPI